MKFTEMFKDAVFVSLTADCSSPYMKKSFLCPDFDEAELTICGLGFFEAYINGERISDDLLVPANSQYEKRIADILNNNAVRDNMSYRVYCLKYDVSRFLIKGENTLGVHLGKGWYNQPTDAHTSGDYCEIKLCFSLTLKSNGKEVYTVNSDSDVLWKQSEVVYNDIYKGERHDYALFDKDFSNNSKSTDGWQNTVEVNAPDSEYFVEESPADKCVRTLEPVLIKTLGKVCIYACSEAVSGYASVVPVCDGANVTVRYADALNSDGSLDFDPTGGEDRIQQDIFLNTKKGNVYIPHFCWHAFRYIEVTRNADIKEVCVVHSDCPVTSDFESDNEILNWLYKTYIRTQLDNMHCGVPSDCPHIERLGYTGDGQLCAEGAMLMLDSKSFYKKWLYDIADSQDVNTGHVQHTAPFMGGGGGPSAWGGAIVVVPYMYWKTYGETDILQEFLPKILKYFDYMESRCENGLLYHEVDGQWCLGDWCAPTEYNLHERHIKSRMSIPETYVNTCLLVKQMYMAIEMAGVLGKAELTEHLNECILKHKRAVEVAYYSPMYKDFCGNVQGANSFALDIGMGGADTVKATVEKYNLRGMYDTGIVATDILTRVLFENGGEQTAFDLLTSKGDISFFNMMVNGATTLWEDWHPERSLNHPMFGAVTRYLFMYLLGIRQKADSAGYKAVIISPCLVNGLKRASGYITTVRGKISVSFEKAEKSADFTITLDGVFEAEFEYKNTKIELKQGKNKIRVDV